MGPKHSQDVLPPKIYEKVIRLFELIDVDHSNTIDKNETLKFWSKNFPKLNTNELFEQVDKNHDGSIQLSEWIEFWGHVLQSGHSEEEIECELDSMISGGCWVKFENVEPLGGSIDSAAKKHGKY